MDNNKNSTIEIPLSRNLFCQKSFLQFSIQRDDVGVNDSLVYTFTYSPPIDSLICKSCTSESFSVRPVEVYNIIKFFFFNFIIFVAVEDFFCDNELCC